VCREALAHERDDGLVGSVVDNARVRGSWDRDIKEAPPYEIFDGTPEGTGREGAEK
jgi:hypothetical protein